MAINYPNMRAMYLRLIGGNGRNIVVRTKDESNFDSVTGTVDIADVNAPSIATFVDITTDTKTDGLVQNGDEWMFSTEEVNIANTIVDADDGTEWQVVFVKKWKPGPLTIGWKVHVRS